MLHKVPGIGYRLWYRRLGDAEKLLTECRRVIKDKIIIFEDMASCRVQNGFTTFHDFWGNKVKWNEAYNFYDRGWDAILKRLNQSFAG